MAPGLALPGQPHYHTVCLGQAKVGQAPPQTAVVPPSRGNATPVVKAARSEHR